MQNSLNSLPPSLAIVQAQTRANKLNREARAAARQQDAQARREARKKQQEDCPTCGKAESTAAITAKVYDAVLAQTQMRFGQDAQSPIDKLFNSQTVVLQENNTPPRELPPTFEAV